jgi:hypothetical protein
MAKPVDELNAIELLRDLAATLEWPTWFDTDDGDKYAEQVRPRLLALASALEDFLGPRS